MCVFVCVWVFPPSSALFVPGLLAPPLSFLPSLLLFLLVISSLDRLLSIALISSSSSSLASQPIYESTERRAEAAIAQGKVEWASTVSILEVVEMQEGSTTTESSSTSSILATLARTE